MITKQTAQKILLIQNCFFGGILEPAGKSYIGVRHHIMEEIKNKRVLKSKCGVHRYKALLIEELKPSGDCEAAQDKDMIIKLKKIAGSDF